MNATISEDVQQQVLGAVRKSQEITRDAIKRAVETVNATTAKLPAVPLVGKLPQLPPVSALPGARALPTPETVVSATFGFIDRLLAERRKFAGELVKATASLRPAAKAAPAETGPAETGPAETGPAETGPAETGPAETGPAETGPAETGPAETGPAETGPAETGPAGEGPASEEPAPAAE